MKSFITVLFLSLVFSLTATASETIRLNDNRIIQLNEDGTYEFVEATEGIKFTLTRLQDEQSFDNQPICSVSFDVTNDSYGTLYWIALNVNAYDDRGDNLGGYASMVLDIDPFENTFADDMKISKGGTASATMKLDGRCEYLETIEAFKVANKYCNMRNLPEGVNCFDLVSVESAVDGVNFVKEE